MRQYLDAKRQYRDAIVFFRMGDFYEMFYEDALVAARALELTLTSRSKDAGGNGIPMCGVPYHAADGYIARLVKKGFRVAICEQVEDPQKAKGLVKREVVRVVSPGTLTEPGYLEAREPAFLMAIVPARDGLRRRRADRPLDRRVHDGRVSRRRRAAGAGRRDRRAAPARGRRARRRERRRAASRDRAAAAAGDQRRRLDLRAETARRALLDQLKTHGLEGFGLEGRTAAIQAAGGLVAYLRDTQKADLAHVRAISYKTSADCLIIDPITLKHLEVVTGSEGGPQGSLLNEIDRTVTSMGGRLLRAWLLRPLCALERIRDRLDAVEELAFRSTERGKFRETLKAVHDLERLVARAALGTAGPRDLVSLRSVAGRGAAREADPARRAGAAAREPVRRARRPDRRSRPDRAHAHRRAAGLRPRRRLHARRRRRRARRAARPSAGPAGRSSPRWKSASARAPASRR